MAEGCIIVFGGLGPEGSLNTLALLKLWQADSGKLLGTWVDSKHFLPAFDQGETRHKMDPSAQAVKGRAGHGAQFIAEDLLPYDQRSPGRLGRIVMCAGAIRSTRGDTHTGSLLVLDVKQDSLGKDEEGSAAEQGEGDEDSLEDFREEFEDLVGAVVEVTGLVKQPHMNGARGVVIKFHPKKGRYRVQVQHGPGEVAAGDDEGQAAPPPPSRQFALKRENLIRVDMDEDDEDPSAADGAVATDRDEEATDVADARELKVEGVLTYWASTDPAPMLQNQPTLEQERWRALRVEAVRCPMTARVGTKIVMWGGFSQRTGGFNGTINIIDTEAITCRALMPMDISQEVCPAPREGGCAFPVNGGAGGILCFGGTDFGGAGEEDDDDLSQPFLLTFRFNSEAEAIMGTRGSL